MVQTCGAAGCHVDVPARLSSSLMATMNGVISVDRWVFGEQPTPTAVTPLSTVAHSPADLHLRNLCVSCHLGAEKREPGPIDERSRGGGCLACHLVTAGGDAGVPHARLRALPGALACTGCHARSGRISLSYEGWHEVTGPCTRPERRELADGRCVERRVPDVHFEAGLGCVDCHGSWEVMGDGRRALHREEASTVRCGDCHAESLLRVTDEALDPESRRLLSRRGLLDAGTWVGIRRSGRPLVNTWMADGGAWLRGKSSGRVFGLKPPAEACRVPVHRALTCATCHSAWVPQCVSCHTTWEPDGGMVDLLDDRERPGEWEEVGGVALAEPPVLGVREGDAGREVIPMAPGMILHLEGHGLQRLYAPVSPHTTRRAVRSCESCHRSSLALGAGRGELWRDGGVWVLKPRFSVLADGLPEDAWLGLLKTRTGAASTREDVRPLTEAEQRRVLTVGACLDCHAATSSAMQRALEGKGERPAKCRAAAPDLMSR